MLTLWCTVVGWIMFSYFAKYAKAYLALLCTCLGTLSHFVHSSTSQNNLPQKPIL